MAMTTQTLVLSKDKFKSRDAAKSWARAHEFKATTIRETSLAYRLRQASPDGFSAESFRTKSITAGVVAVVGEEKA